jgi:hypothetical protein
MRIKIFLILVLAAAQAMSCSTQEPARRLKLVWAEELNYSGPPDSKVWSYEVGFIRNQESQYYTEGR